MRTKMCCVLTITAVTTFLIQGMADGVAPGAKIAFADIGTEAGDLLPPRDRQLLATGRERCGDGCANIHSASWGGELSMIALCVLPCAASITWRSLVVTADTNAYTVQARNFDQYMHDNDDFLIVIAAGNSGNVDGRDVPNTVGSPATGKVINPSARFETRVLCLGVCRSRVSVSLLHHDKNIIAVGAHHNTGTSAPRGLGPPYIADFSSRGKLCTLDPNNASQRQCLVCCAAYPMAFLLTSRPNVGWEDEARYISSWQSGAFRGGFAGRKGRM